MKIGVFGDSYADRGFACAPSAIIWYSFLQQDHGHEIDCFGEAGSSIMFSANLIQRHANNYDLAIWCLTTPGRYSLPHVIDGRTVHVTTAWDQCAVDDIEIAKKHSVCIDYLKYIFDWEQENFIGQSIVHFMQHKFPNLLIVPCFPAPLQCDFNLYTLCEKEANYYFANQSIPEIYKHYNDRRPGHLTSDNQKVLADLINQNLQPGIFQTSYDNFVRPSQSFDQCFVAK
jgi:hypothetical protein